MIDTSYIAPVTAVVGAFVSVLTATISIGKARQEKQKGAEEMKRKDAELEQAAIRHKQHLDQIAENTRLTIEHAAKLQAAELKLSQYINLTQRVFDLDHLFVQHSHLRLYFYDEHIVDGRAELQKITALTEYILDFYSSLQEHEALLSDASPSWVEWTAYIEDGFRSSPFMCQYFEKNKDWYEEGLAKIYQRVAGECEDVIQRQREALAAALEGRHLDEVERPSRT